MRNLTTNILNSMASEKKEKKDDNPYGPIKSREELDALQNRMQIRLAAHEALVRSWTERSRAAKDIVRKTDSELDAEDAALFQPQPAYLGLGCPIPEEFLVTEKERGTMGLEKKFGNVLKASKKRDAEEKLESRRRGLREESSEEEEGRSGVGKKKRKVVPVKKVAKVHPAAENLVAEVHSKAEKQAIKGEKHDKGEKLMGKDTSEDADMADESEEEFEKLDAENTIATARDVNSGTRELSKEERKKLRKREQKRKAKERKKVLLQQRRSESL